MKGSADWTDDRRDDKLNFDHGKEAAGEGRHEADARATRDEERRVEAGDTAGEEHEHDDKDDVERGEHGGEEWKEGEEATRDEKKERW